jgi:hypothetical protein
MFNGIQSPGFSAGTGIGGAEVGATAADVGAGVNWFRREEDLSGNNNPQGSLSTVTPKWLERCLHQPSFQWGGTV